MANPKKNVQIKASTVNVNKQRKRKARKSKSNSIVRELESGMATRNDISGYGGIENMSTLRSARATVQVDTNSVGWFFKYLDPAGATETCRAIGEYSKVPDGLVKYSVDAEQRLLYNESCPVLTTDSNLPLDGRLWSLVIISLPCFRTGYIAVASTTNQEVGSNIISALCLTLNNLTNWREVVDDDVWLPFVDSDDTWYYRIRVFPPNYALLDPDITTARTVTAYRITYKSLTVEFNAPTLIDQGFWAGGHYAITPVITEQNPATQFEHTIPISIHRGNQFQASFTWVGLPSGGTNLSPVNPQWVQNTDVEWFSWRHGGNTFPSDGVIYDVPPTYQITTPLGVIFAQAGDTIKFNQTGAGTYILSNETNDAIQPITYLLPTPNTTLTESFSTTGGIQSSNRINIPLPPLTLSQIIANNPKMEQFPLKETMGAYLVHSKMRSPVFNLTPADSFGGFSFKDSFYNDINNITAPLGIRDSFDSNLSTGVVVFRGMSVAATAVIKGYMGWEGVTSVNTPMGQFAHSGIEKNPEILDLADNLAGTKLTGIYPATDNFAGAIAAYGMEALSELLRSEATQSKVREVADNAQMKAMNFVGSKVNRKGGLLSTLSRPLISMGGTILNRLLGRR